jgi:hypothetical protein
MGYVVFEDLEWAAGPAVHSDSCRRYRQRKPGAATVRWHEGFADYASAAAKANAIARPPKYPARLDPPCCRPGPR